MRKTLKRRQKPTQQHYGTDGTNAETARQYFQVTLNILEARKLSWSNPHSTNSYVIAVIGKKKYRTTVRKNMLEPVYRECFVFEMYHSIIEMQEQSIWLAVMEPRCCSSPQLMGETNVDLGAVWRQPNHQVFHKWAQLSLPRDPAAGVVGFLKVDISITFCGDIEIMPALISEYAVEDNLLLPSGSEQQRANYVINVHGAFGLSRGTASSEKRKLPSTFAKVSFCGLTAKTAVQQRNCNPVYSEQISMVEMFPNMSHVIRFDVCSGDGCINRLLGSAQLNLEQISHDGENGFLPTFGPSLLHMYGAPNNQVGDNGPCYRGSLLVSLKTEVPYYQQVIRTTSVEPVPPIKIDNLWTWGDFCIFCPILEVSMLDRRTAGKLCGAAITIGEMPGDNILDEEFDAMVHEIRSRKLHYTGSIDVLKNCPVYGYLDFTNSFPVLQQALRLPDFRFRMYRNNMVYNIVSSLECVLEEVEGKLKMPDYSTPDELFDVLKKALNDTAVKLSKFLELIPYSNLAGSNCELCRPYTELDQKQMTMHKEEVEKIYRQIAKESQCESIDSFRYQNNLVPYRRICITGSRKSLKILISHVKSLVQDLKNIIFKTPDGSPDIVVWLLNAGSRVAYARIAVSDVIYSVVPEQCGKSCSRIQTIYMKPLKCSIHANVADCYCTVGKIELLVWMGLYSEISAFETFLPHGYKIKVRDNEMCLKASTVMLECRLFIHGAKIINTENSNLTHTFVRITVMSVVKETQPKPKSSTLVWNQMIRIYKMTFASQDRVTCHPITATVEVYDSDLAENVDFLGRFDIQPVIDDRQDYEHAPKLQWHDINRGMERTGQLLISAQLLQIPETLMRSTTYEPIDKTYYVAEVKDIQQESDQIELLPDILVPQSTTFKIDIYWWGLREVNVTRKPCVVLELDELIIKSDIIINKKSNANFPNGRSSHTFETTLSENLRPPLTIKLCDNSTFGRTMFFGTNVVKNPYKYLVKWLPENQRESSLKSMSVLSSNYYQVSPMFFEKTTETSMYACNQSIHSNFKNNGIINMIHWKKLFCSKEPDEEECALLPIFSRDREQTKANALETMHRKKEETDWWMRFYCSQKEYDENEGHFYSDTITIYNSELEAQPEFSKFKDWCSTLKLYNGKKTGIPEKDEQLRCGYLKAGIVMYKWPPDTRTVAVSPQGVDLNKGYFSEYPNNDPTRHLVRVYVIRGLNLIAKEFTGKSDPYVVIGCGARRLGDRNTYISNSVNPVFGKMYEFRCTLPEDYMLAVSLYDYDTIAPDELIGTTTIDLENRIYTKHRAQIGLPKEYNVSGPAKWRDFMKPSAILEELCIRNHVSPPVYTDVNRVVFNGVEYKESERNAQSYTYPSERRQSICLNLLHKWNTMPVCGYKLVPEHVETRSLFNPERPGIEQGKIQMWVDIYPLNGTYIPPPVDVSPRSAEDYELRVVVWKVRRIKLKEWYGKELADVYVKAWIGSVEQTQYTDVHYQSEFGEAAFNWRMIFNFQYQYNKIKLMRRDTVEYSEYEESVPPILVVQVLDSEAVSKEELVGTLTLDLSSLPRGVDVSSQCIPNVERLSDKINLFTTRSARSWWPLTIIDRDTGIRTVVGVIDLELTLLPTETAILMPVGTGRDPPSPLPEPWRCTGKHSRPVLSWESVFRHGSIEYFIVGAIIIISLTAAVWYFEMPSHIYQFFFE